MTASHRRPLPGIGPKAVVAAEIDVTTAHPARMYDYLLLRHEALRYRVEVRDLHRWAVAAA